MPTWIRQWTGGSRGDGDIKSKCRCRRNLKSADWNRQKKNFSRIDKTNKLWMRNILWWEHQKVNANEFSEFRVNFLEHMPPSPPPPLTHTPLYRPQSASAEASLRCNPTIPNPHFCLPLLPSSRSRYRFLSPRRIFVISCPPRSFLCVRACLCAFSSHPFTLFFIRVGGRGLLCRRGRETTLVSTRR